MSERTGVAVGGGRSSEHEQGRDHRGFSCSLLGPRVRVPWPPPPSHRPARAPRPCAGSGRPPSSSRRPRPRARLRPPQADPAALILWDPPAPRAPMTLGPRPAAAPTPVPWRLLPEHTRRAPRNPLAARNVFPEPASALQEFLQKIQREPISSPFPYCMHLPICSAGPAVVLKGAFVGTFIARGSSRHLEWPGCSVCVYLSTAL